MYSVSSVYADGNAAKIVTPDCMYRVAKIYDNDASSISQNAVAVDGRQSQTQSQTLVSRQLLADADRSDGWLEMSLNDLLSRQRLLSARIESLEKQIDGVTTDDSGQSTVAPKPSSSQVMTGDGHASVGRRDVVVFADTSHTPVYLFVILKQLKRHGIQVMVKVHYHSSLIGDNNTGQHWSELSALLAANQILISSEDSLTSRLDYELILTIIFKRTSEPFLVIDPSDSVSIAGPSNIARFLVRFGAQLRPQLGALYEGIGDTLAVTLVDNFLDEIDDQLLTSTATEAKYLHFESHLKDNRYLTGNALTLADLLLWSAVIANSSPISWQRFPNLNRWTKNIVEFNSLNI